MNFHFKMCVLTVAAVLIICAAHAQDVEKLTTINVVTPMWEDQTQEDGTGLFFDVIRKVYEPSGIQLKFEIMPWQRAEEMVAAGQADAVPAAYRDNPGVYPKYPLYVDYTTAVFKKSHIKEWKGPQTLKEKNVIWIRGYNFQDIPALIPLAMKWSEIDDYEQAWGMLENDRIDAYLESLIDLERYIRNNQIDMSQYQMEILVAKNAYIKFSNSNKSKKLIEIYDKRIPELMASGELKTMFEKWKVKFEPFKPEND
jgi:polar amino acid transport system substrate-binding protein